MQSAGREIQFGDNADGCSCSAALLLSPNSFTKKGRFKYQNEHAYKYCTINALSKKKEKERVR